MKPRRTRLMAVLLGLLMLTGCLMFLLPPLLQDTELTHDAQAYDDLAQTLKLPEGESSLDGSISGMSTRATPEPGDRTPVPFCTPAATPTPVPTESPVQEPAFEPRSLRARATAGFLAGILMDPNMSGAQDAGSSTQGRREVTESSEAWLRSAGKAAAASDILSPVRNPEQYNLDLAAAAEAERQRQAEAARLAEEARLRALQTPVPTPVPTPVVTEAPTPTPEPTPVTGKTNADLKACRDQNSDFIAWIQIPGTKVDYPVVHTDDVDYYLTHTFTGKKSSLGTLFSPGKADYKTPSRNIAIYGHDVEGSGSKMFKALLKYKNKAYYDAHPTIYFDTWYRPGVYTIFAVLDIMAGDWDPSRASFAGKTDFAEFISRAQAASLYDTGVTVGESDTIISLITCDRYFARKVGRFVVMAVKTE